MIDEKVCMQFREKMLVLALVTFMIMMSFSSIIGAVIANVGGGSLFGYEWTDSKSPAPSVTFGWIEINGTGTDTGMAGDDNSISIPIGFTFPFFGNSYTIAYPSTNGLIAFGNETFAFSNWDIPSTYTPDNMIMAYWDDLCVVYGTGNVLYKLIGSAPSRQLVVEWYQVQPLSGGQLMTFEVILSESGNIIIQYLTLNGMGGSSASVGIENANGSDGCKYSYNQGVLSDNLAISFDFGFLGFGPSQSETGFVGSDILYNITVTNRQTVADSFDLTSVSGQGWTVGFYDSTGAVPLTDTNGDLSGHPDTGNIPAGGHLNITVKVAIPASPAYNPDVENITATSHANSALSGTVTLITRFIPAMLHPPHSDFGRDTNGDGLYDYLVVEVSVNTIQAGAYIVAGTLVDSSLSFIASCFHSIYLNGSASTVELEFNGWHISENAVDGPYEAMISIYEDYSYDLLDEGTYTTNAYTCGQFIAAPSFNPPHSDNGMDTNADGLYDYLVVEVSLNITTEGYYWIFGSIHDGSFSWIDDESNYTHLDSGIQTVYFLFDGRIINDFGVDGPYIVSLQLDDGNYSFIDSDTYTTGAYTIDQFQTKTSFNTPHSEHVRDIDSDGFYDFLVVDISLNVTVDGYYSISGYLRDAYFNSIDSDYNYTYLNVGTQTVEISFDGNLISDNGVDGPFNVTLYLYDDSYVQLDDASFDTNAYTADQFEIKSTFEPPHSDHGFDTDGDGLFNYLVVDVVVNTTDAGVYAIHGGWMSSADNVTYLDPGMNIVELMFYGPSFYNLGTTDSYGIWLQMSDGDGNTLDTDYYDTGVYSFDQFDPPPLVFQPPHGDIGLDIDGNGLFDFLVINATVNVTEAGEYTIISVMYDTGMNLHGPVMNTGFLGVGLHSVQLMFPASRINSNGVDGQFQVILMATDESGHNLDQDFFVSASYDHDQFESPLATLGAPFDCYGTDWDENGKFEHLIVEVNVEVTVAGWYTVVGEIVDSALRPILSASNFTYLGIGNHSVVLTYSGEAISDSCMNPSLVFFELRDANNVPIDAYYTMAGGYAWTDFETGGVFEPRVDYILIRDAPNGAGTLVSDIILERGSGVYFWCAGYNYSYGFVKDCTAVWTSSNLSIVSVTTPGASTMVSSSIVNIGNAMITANYSGRYETANIIVKDMPRTTAMLSGTKGDNGWYTSAVEVTLSATDAMEGVSRTSYKIDAASWQTYGSAFDVASEGKHTLYYYSVDNGNNTEKTKAVGVKIDMTAPTLSITQANGTKFNRTTVEISWTGSDETSGIDRYETSVDGAAFQTKSASTTSIALANLTEGEHSITLRAVDSAGLVTEKTIRFTISVPKTEGAEPSPLADIIHLILFAVLASLIFVLIALILLMRRKKDGTEGRTG